MKRRTFSALTETTLSALLQSELQVSSARSLGFIEQGAVYCNGRRCQQPEKRVSVGVTVSVVMSESGLSAEEPAALLSRLHILFEDERLLVVDKPAGVLAQPSPLRTGTSLLDMASAHLGQPAGLVHRLDKDTSGVTVFGKTGEATSALAGCFKDRTAAKTYLAVVDGSMVGEGVIALKLRKDPARPGRFLAEQHGNGKEAETAFRVIKSGPQSMVALFPRTGRTHQLRAHLSALGFPITGDRLYGGSERAARCLLHAYSLTIEGRSYQAPVPDDMRAWYDDVTLEKDLT
jgi:23S rRNA pseudouridine1911/1915/1917 synthase